MHKKAILFFTLLLLMTSFIQAQLSTDTSVKVLPHWKKGEVHNVIIKSTTDKFLDGKSDKIISTFKAKFSIIEKDTSGYKIEWIYTSADLDPNKAIIEDNILAKLIGEKLIFKLSITGRFKELLNSDEVKASTDRAIDQLLGSISDTVQIVGLKAAKQLTSSKKAIEVVLLKQVKFYNLSFGFDYKTNKEQMNEIQFPNPMGEEPFDAIEKVKLTKLDNQNSVCIIETTKNVDANVLKNEVAAYLKKNYKSGQKQIDRDFANKNLIFSENTTQQIDFSKGLLIKGNLTRKMNIGIQERLIELEIETID